MTVEKQRSEQVDSLPVEDDRLVRACRQFAEKEQQRRAEERRHDLVSTFTRSAYAREQVRMALGTAGDLATTSATTLGPEQESPVEQRQASEPDSRQRAGILSRDDVINEPDATPLVHGLIDRGRLTMIAGPSGCGKSVLQLHICAALLNAQSVFGHAIPRPARFLYINLEGDLKHRLLALEQHQKGWEFPEADAMFMTRSWLLSDKDAVEVLAREILLLGGVDVIFVDTLNRAMAGSDENSSSDMGKIITNAQILIQLTGAAVVLTHHTGKTKERGPRGHSSLFAALDNCLMVDKGESGVRTVELTKTRNGPDGLKHYFEIEGVSLGPDKFGLPISAPALKELKATPEVVRAGDSRAMSNAHQEAYVAVSLQLRVEPNSPKGSLPYDDALNAVKCAFASRYESKHRSTRARQALQALVDTGMLIRDGNQIMLRDTDVSAGPASL